MTCPPGHVEYLSAATASNAATLHTLANPWCDGVNPFECGDHFHIGHPDPTAGELCKQRMRATPSPRDRASWST